VRTGARRGAAVKPTRKSKMSRGKRGAAAAYRCTARRRC